MIRMMQAAAVAGLVALCAGRAVYAQEPEPQQPAMPTPQGDHLTEAVKQTQAAIDAGNSGQARLVVEHAQQALSHAKAAEKEQPSPNLEEAIKRLQEAVKQGKSGRVDVAMKAAQVALQKLQG